jgi:hypothetical protein
MRELRLIVLAEVLLTLIEFEIILPLAALLLFYDGKAANVQAILSTCSFTCKFSNAKR